MIIHNPGNHLKVDEMFAFLGVDKDGNEGLCAAPVGGMTLPLVGADMARVDSLKPLVRQIASASGMTVRLVKFSQKDVLEVFRP